MPIPKSKDVGKTIKFLKKENPGMPQKQKVAIALDVARRSGAKIPKKQGMSKTSVHHSPKDTGWWKK